MVRLKRIYEDPVPEDGLRVLVDRLWPRGIVQPPLTKADQELAALQATMLAYLRRDGQAIPFWRMATTPTAALRARAESMVAAVAAAGGEAEVVACRSVAGGGSVPGLDIPSAGVGGPGGPPGGPRPGAAPGVPATPAVQTLPWPENHR